MAIRKEGVSIRQANYAGWHCDAKGCFAAGLGSTDIRTILRTARNHYLESRENGHNPNDILTVKLDKLSDVDLLLLEKT